METSADLLIIHTSFTLMTLTEESSDQRINSLIIKILVGVTMILKEVYIIVEELEDTYYWLVTKPVVNDILFDLAPIAELTSDGRNGLKI